MQYKKLDKPTLHQAVQLLCRQDADLARIQNCNGYPPLWARPASFRSLVQIILEQQVSLRSAKAVYLRLSRQLGGITAENILKTGPNGLRKAGLTRQKTAYILGLARSIVDGDLKLRTLHRASEASIRRQLLSMKGIGPWTTDIFLLMTLGRPDIWPQGDLALNQSMRRLKRLPAAGEPEIQKIAESWRPWRSVAARMLWHDYLNRRR